MADFEFTEIFDIVALFALCLWREARGEGQDGMRAVGHVIKKRADTWYADFAQPIYHAIMARGQFTSMSDPRDPEFRLHPAPRDPQYAFCLSIAVTILAGTDPDNTLSALYYANLTQISQDSWFMREIVNKPQAHPKLTQINQHTFYA